jgi:chaperone modulatory protein CbpM
MNRWEFEVSSGVEIQTLDIWLEREWLAPEFTSDGLRFSDIDVARARLIHDLKRGFGANDEGIDIILHLIDQLNGVRSALVNLQDEMREHQRQKRDA